MKKLRKGEARFICKKVDRAWRVYDVANGSFPYQTPELGKVLQDVDYEECKAESNRLNELVGIAPVNVPMVKSSGSVSAKDMKVNSSPAPTKKRGAAPPPVAETIEVDTWISSEELPDYGDLSDQTDGYVDWKETAIPKEGSR